MSTKLKVTAKVAKQISENPLALEYVRQAAATTNKNKQYELITKAAITTGVFSDGGILNPKQQSAYVKYVRAFATFLGRVRTHRMTSPKEEIDRMWIGEPITKPAAENDPTQVLVTPKFNKIALETTKVRSDWDITTETIQSSIETDDFERSVFDGFMSRIAMDLELLGIAGDTTITGTDPTSVLLKIKDGWFKQGMAGHVVDMAGASVSKGIFAEMWRALPQQYRNNPNLTYFVSSSTWIDWLDLISERGTPIGDRALSGGEGGATIFGRRVVEIPTLPENMLINVGGATAPTHIGNQLGPFEFGSSLTVILNVNGAGNSTTTIPAGTYTESEIAYRINQQLADDSAAQVAGDTGGGALVLRTPLTGSTQSIVVGSGTANAILGLTTGHSLTGANAGTNQDYLGSFIWLTDPRNFIFGVLDGTRIFSEFIRVRDAIGVTVFNQVDYKIENVDAMVTATNVSRRDLL